MDPAALNLTTKVLGYGRFLFIRLDQARVDAALLKALEASGYGLENAHFASGQPSEQSLNRGRIEYLRAQPNAVRERDIADEGISQASVLIRLEGNAPQSLLQFEHGVRALIEARGGEVEVREGVRKDRSYTSYAMTQFAYAKALAPDTGARHPVAVFLPQRKTREWWEMDWMRRESYFLPRYADDGRVVVKGHTLASADGIPHLVRRLYHHPAGYGLDFGYDFLGYFEFAEEDAAVFDAVMRGLRDRQQNPEWSFVREGPEWWGRRVAAPEALWS